MSSQSKIFTTIIILMLFLISILAFFFFRQPTIPSRSLLLYRNYSSPETVTNWIVDTDTGEKWEVGNGLAASHWSPLGKQIAFHTLSPLPFEIWVSDNKGDNIRQVFNNTNYPDLKITDYGWLTDETIIVNGVKNFQAFGYLLDINTLTFERIPNSTSFVHLSPNDQFWIEFNLQDKYSFFNLEGQRTQLPQIELWHHYFSPTEEKIAYSCAGKYKYSSLCIADVSISGITNEQKIIEDALLNAYGELFWSLDGKYIGFLYSPEDTKETHFKAIDVSSKSIIYDWKFPTQTTLNFWSPDSSKIIDYTGVLLDLKTGQISNFFTDINEPASSQIVDWRFIEVP